MPENHSVSTSAASKGPVSRIFGQYIIKHRFQFKFSLIVFVFLAVAGLATWLMGHYAVNQLIKSGVVQGEHAITNLKMVNTMVGQISLLMLAVLFGLSLFFSHFVAGPIYRFEKVFEAMEQGDLSMIVRLRKRDELKDTAELFNRALSGLRKRLRLEREEINVVGQKVKKIAEKLREAGRNAEADELLSASNELTNKTPHVKI